MELLISNPTLSVACVEKSIRKWLSDFVIDKNLCPFARRELIDQRVKFIVSDALAPEHLLQELQNELKSLLNDESFETTLLIHPYVLTDFYEYNDFLFIVDDLLVDMQLEGVFQVASFHPQYQFAGTQLNDVENHTNRAPYPLLHILSEETVEKRIQHYPNVDEIPERNIALMNELGESELQRLALSYFDV